MSSFSARKIFLSIKIDDLGLFLERGLARRVQDLEEAGEEKGIACFRVKVCRKSTLCLHCISWMLVLLRKKRRARDSFEDERYQQPIEVHKVLEQFFCIVSFMEMYVVLYAFKFVLTFLALILHVYHASFTLKINVFQQKQGRIK